MDIEDSKIRETIQESRPNLKMVSIKQYEAQLKKLKSMFDSSNYDFLEAPEQVEKALEEKHFTTKRNFYNAIIILLLALNSDNQYDDLVEQYSDMRDQLNNKYIEENKTGIISDKQSPNFATMEEVDSMLSQMKSDIQEMKNKTQTQQNKSLIRAYTLFTMLKHIPTRNDYANLLYINKKAYDKLTQKEKVDNNYLVLDRSNKTMKLILNVYKTAKKYGENIIEVPKKVQTTIRQYLTYMKYKVGDNIFPMTKNALSQLLLKYSFKYSGKKISSTLMRKIYLSDKYADVKKEMEKDAKIMGNSVAVQQSSYVKEAKE